MSFTSPLFFAGLIPAVALFHGLPARLRCGYLLILSYAVYWLLAPRALPLLVAATLATYVLSAAIARAPRYRHALLLVGIVALSALLLFFKLRGLFSHKELALPLGLSFYTFRLLGYLIEAHADPASHEPRLSRFAVWVAFFPQIVSGPIQRAHEFLPQIDSPAFKRSDFAVLESGCGAILYGLFQKLVIADRLSRFVVEIESHSAVYPRWALIASSQVAVLQIFCDLSGYTSLAIGIGRLFGIEGPPNFNAPLVASSVPDFWRRWHMSLTRWLMDYVYLPVRMRLRRWRAPGVAVSLLITMLLIGLWHRVSFGYFAFGLLHGLAMIVSVSTPRLKINRVIAPFLIFHWVAFTQLLASAPTLGDGLHRLGALVHATPAPRALPVETWLPALACSLTAIAIGTGLVDRVLARLAIVPNWLRYAVALMIVLLLGTGNGEPFIYGSF
jgi:D-alanyl-lipoteichoic acid acyltransferase DltB (MBOAT superfamily)